MPLGTWFQEDLESIEVNIYIDGKKVDCLTTSAPLEEGMKLESEAITLALQGRKVINISFSGTMVNVSTEAT